MTPAEAINKTIHTQNMCSSPAAVMIIDLLMKPDSNGNPEIAPAPMMQKIVVSGMDLCKPPSSVAFVVPTRCKTAPIDMNNNAL